MLALVAGGRTPVRSAGPPGAGLGPDSGELVGDYLRRATASLDPTDGDGGPRYALLSPASPLTPAAAAALAEGVRVSQVLLRVPVERVQTPLAVREVVDQGGGVAEELLGLQRREAADLLARPASGRPGAVAALAADQLAQGCACVVGLVLRGGVAELGAVAGRGGVRALELAPAGTGPAGLSVAPLLPSHTVRVEPGPDDAPVPGAG